MPKRCRSHPLPARRPPFTTLLLAPALAALAACTTLPQPATDPTAGVEPPAQWLQSAPDASHAPTDLARWWQRFDDPSLAALVDDALRANPSLDTAAANWRQARALREAAEAGLLPTLDAGASAQRARTTGLPSRNTFNLGLDASWELDLFGRLRAGASAAAADEAASADSLADVQVSVAAETALAYLELRGLGLRLAIARENLAAQEETLQLVRWREQAGLASSVEVQQAETSAEQTRAQLPALQQSAAQTLHALAVLTGRTPQALAAHLGTDGSEGLTAGGSGAAAPDTEADTASTASIPLPQEDLVLSLPADTLRQRPDVRAAERQVQAAAARVQQADAARYPSLTLGGSIGLAASTLSGLTAGGAVVNSLVGSVSLPLFDGGALRAQVDAQQAALDAARASHRSTVLAALQEAEDALVALRRTRERLAALRQAATAADAAALLARQRYESGLVDFQVVLETQRTLLTTEDAVAAAQADLASGHVNLYKALGGGWRPDTVAGAADTTNEARATAAADPTLPATTAAAAPAR